MTTTRKATISYTIEELAEILHDHEISNEGDIVPHIQDIFVTVTNEKGTIPIHFDTLTIVFEDDDGRDAA
jgi:hypothetical protein